MRLVLSSVYPLPLQAFVLETQRLDLATKSGVLGIKIFPLAHARLSHVASPFFASAFSVLSLPQV
jgi:hypothetical protein